MENTNKELELKRLRDNYFEARSEFNEKRRKQNYDHGDLLRIAEDYGYAKGRYVEFKSQNPSIKIVIEP